MAPVPSLCLWPTALSAEDGCLNLNFILTIPLPPAQDLDDIDTYDSSVVNCLQDYSAEIKSEQCKAQVNKYVKLAAQVWTTVWTGVFGVRGMGEREICGPSSSGWALMDLRSRC